MMAVAISITIAVWLGINLAIMLIRPLWLAMGRVLGLCRALGESKIRGATALGHLLVLLMTIVMFPLLGVCAVERLIDRASNK